MSVAALAQDEQDGDGDEQTDDRVGEREPGQHAERPADDRQRGEPVGAGVQPVGDERRRADRASDPDAVDRDELVAREADDPGRDDDPRVASSARGRAAAGSTRSRRRPPTAAIISDDEDAGEVLGAAVAVGVAAVRRPPAEDERDPQRDRGQGVGEVVDRVGQQRHRAGDDHEQCLGEGGDPERDEADLDGADALGAGLERGVDRVGGVVAVRLEEARETPRPRRARGRASRVRERAVVVVVVRGGRASSVRLPVGAAWLGGGQVVGRVARPGVLGVVDPVRDELADVVVASR